MFINYYKIDRENNQSKKRMSDENMEKSANKVENEKYKKNVKNIVKVTISNFLKLLSGVLVGFLLPKIIGVVEFGYYKTFTLYATYVGLLAFGIIDGIYLKYGGKKYEELDQNIFIFYTNILILFHLIISIIVVLISLFFIKGEYKFIFICLSVFLIANNMTGYYQQISQITGRFKELSLRNVIYSIVTCLSIVVLWILNRFYDYVITYKVYTICYILIFAFLTIWYMFTYRNITFGKIKNLKTYMKEIPGLIKIGLPLMVANLCSLFILTLDRQFVNIIWKPTNNDTTYSIYAFAYSMLTLVTTATTAISTVLYPSLKNENFEYLKNNYSRFVAIILVIVNILLLSYYPLCFVVDSFLLKYHDSLIIFRIIFPGLIANSAITIVMHNYYKVLGLNNKFFVKTVIILTLAFILNLIAYLIFKTTISISIASIITLILWYIYVESYLIKEFKIKWLKNFIYMITMIIVFYLVTIISNYILGFFIHFVITIILAFIFYYKETITIVKMVCKKN